MTVNTTSPDGSVRAALTTTGPVSIKLDKSRDHTSESLAKQVTLVVGAALQGLRRGHSRLFGRSSDDKRPSTNPRNAIQKRRALRDARIAAIEVRAESPRGLARAYWCGHWDVGVHLHRAALRGNDIAGLTGEVNAALAEIHQKYLVALRQVEDEVREAIVDGGAR